MLNELRFCVFWSRELSRSYAQYPVQEMANDQEKKQLLPWPPYAGQSSSDARMQQASHPMQAVPR
ncbi:hypothetical protein PF002_g9545 [Phytophthora fragariae]|uniref:Uncharacterized protein n=1 Tax=Phytophthora fragariae TaxID=53985 RepID=A0A6A3T540_9STRA|nr:hypothetical protein PF003_g35421 [Phytophthora fragariae]KAE8939424.1 hypothetical protein PF009_g10727 [Phytophthora fragariae]KAE8989376.1 hypothetical protein PF011_g18798 [Phytophthora fragariae]KAE9124155.1 hypothetical protein PF006_g17258 [Phytophthora fragariae]KAE9237165.1 hypothetical protein PF004_g8648 [Phytophthora fragariae]